MGVNGNEWRSGEKAIIGYYEWMGWRGGAGRIGGWWMGERKRAAKAESWQTDLHLQPQPSHDIVAGNVLLKPPLNNDGGLLPALTVGVAQGLFHKRLAIGKDRPQIGIMNVAKTIRHCSVFEGVVAGGCMCCAHAQH